MPTAVPLIRLAAWFGPPGGGPPNYAQPPSEEWSVDRIDESDPAHPVAYLTRANTGFAVDRTALFDPREVQIWACDITLPVSDPDYRVTPLFWGEVTSNRLVLGVPERETAVAKVERYHYGQPLEGEVVWDPLNEELLTVHRDARFNPTIDAKVAGNMAPTRDGHASMPNEYNLWIDPESSRTDEAAEVHDQTSQASKWSLGLAVETLQRMLNAAEDFITNTIIFTDPFTPEAPFDEAQDPENITLKRGLYLDECLRILLPQYGCVQHLAFVEDDSPGHAGRFIRPELRYYQRGVGTAKDVQLEAFGEALDADETDALSADINFDVANLVNRVLVHGHPQEREVTIELVRGWSADDDSLDADDLKRGASDSMFEEHPEVHRRWVANEGGDYNGLRVEITEALDLSSVFVDGYAPKRRQLYPPLTYRGQLENEEAGLRRPVKVEYSTNNGVKWDDISGDNKDGVSMRPILLPNEIGVYINTGAIPEALIDPAGDPENLRMRVTGTLLGDTCLVGEADIPSWAANPHPATLVIDAADRFFNRQRQTTGPHASTLDGAYDERDDQADIDSFAEAMRDQAAAASVTARITLSGIITDYTVSDLLTGISGRNISFNRSGDPGTPLYVQVVGRIFDGAAQQTTLVVMPYDIPVSRGRSAA